MNELFISHPHGTIYENKRNKYHISLISSNMWLCNKERDINYSSNGDPITLEWYKANIDTDIDGQVCKKCAKKALFILESKAGFTEYNLQEGKREVMRRLVALEKIENELFNTRGFGFSQNDENNIIQTRLLQLGREIRVKTNKGPGGSYRTQKDITISSCLNSDKYGVIL